MNFKAKYGVHEEFQSKIWKVQGPWGTAPPMASMNFIPKYEGQRIFTLLGDMKNFI